MAYVGKPLQSISGAWVISIRKSISPLSEVIERLTFDNREAAWLTYEKLKKGI